MAFFDWGTLYINRVLNPTVLAGVGFVLIFWQTRYFYLVFCKYSGTVESNTSRFRDSGFADQNVHVLKRISRISVKNKRTLWRDETIPRSTFRCVSYNYCQATGIDNSYREVSGIRMCLRA